MSKIGKQLIIIPADVQVKSVHHQIEVKGPRGVLVQTIPDQVELNFKDLTDGQKELKVKIKRKTKTSSALWGLTRVLIANMVKGVTDGFEKKLEIEGVGYKASLQDNKLVLNIGFSHPVEIEAPEGVKFSVEKNTITVFGIDKQQVGQMAAQIRAFRKPEPYKGKGIRYSGETVKRKVGKKAAGAE